MAILVEMIVRRHLAAATAFAGVCSLAAWLAAEPVLHEYFNLEGGTAIAALPLPNDPGAGSRVPTDPALVSGAVAQPIGEDPGDAYRLDGNTARPEEVGYSDPFTPSIPPFKRLYAYDTVTDAFELGVANPTPVRLTVGGRVGPGDDQFFAELPLALSPQPTRIPSVGPQTRVIAAEAVPHVDFELTQDSAGNWFVQAQSATFTHLVLHLAIDRRVFGSPFSTRATWESLSRYLPALPRTLRQHTALVARRIQIDDSIPPYRVADALIHYFRDFEPSPDGPATRGVQLYHDIALSQIGVCRHRAFAFVVTALGLGLPARFVRNEAHAWSELYDGELWHRVDLGGAAGRLDFTQTPGVPHVAPEDPYGWPPNSEPSTDMVERALETAEAASPRPDEPSRETGLHDEMDTSGAEPTAPPLPSDDALFHPPPSRLSVQSNVSEVLRGQRFELMGRVTSENAEGCGLLRIDVVLLAPPNARSASAQDPVAASSREQHPVGTLVTDAGGRFQGALVIPKSIPVGDYQLAVSTHGNALCGPGASFVAQ